MTKPRGLLLGSCPANPKLRRATHVPVPNRDACHSTAISSLRGASGTNGGALALAPPRGKRPIGLLAAQDPPLVPPPKREKKIGRRVPAPPCSLAGLAAGDSEWQTPGLALRVGSSPTELSGPRNHRVTVPEVKRETGYWYVRAWAGPGRGRPRGPERARGG